MFILNKKMDKLPKMYELEIKSNEFIPPQENINICFVGGVSTGKSTILNAVFCEQLTQCKIKRTTMVPTIYIENTTSTHDQSIIFKTISDKNQELIEKSENGEQLSPEDYNELKFNVGKLDINILQDTLVNVYDIPGLNDARTKDTYYNYLETNFHKFNIVIFLVDIHSGLNTSDEIDILNFITNNTKYQLEKNNRKIFTLVVVNKADDMQLNEETNKLEFTGELKEMYDQVQKTIHDEFTRKEIHSQLIDIIPLCAIDAYLYRMVKKHGHAFKLSPEQILKIGINENGKKFSTLKPDVQEKKVYEILNDETFIDTMIQLSGFKQFEILLHEFLKQNDTGKAIQVDNLLYDLRKLPSITEYMQNKSVLFNLKDLNDIVFQYYKIYNNIKTIDYVQYKSLFNKMITEIDMLVENSVERYPGSNIITLLTLFDEFVETIIKSYIGITPVHYPDYLIEKIISIIKVELESHIKSELLIEYFNILKKINMFNSDTCIELITVLLNNKRKEKSIYITNVDHLIVLFKELILLGMNISRFVRFVIINEIETKKFSDEILIIKKMIYYKYREIPIYHYLQTLTTSVSIHTFVNGLDDFEESEDYKLDLYYLQHCKDTINFM